VLTTKSRRNRTISGNLVEQRSLLRNRAVQVAMESLLVKRGLSRLDVVTGSDEAGATVVKSEGSDEVQRSNYGVQRGQKQKACE
jgi:hypothetical protein